MGWGGGADRATLVYFSRSAGVEDSPYCKFEIRGRCLWRVINSTLWIIQATLYGILCHTSDGYILDRAY